jgi:hypothetical protein
MMTTRRSGVVCEGSCDGIGKVLPEVCDELNTESMLYGLYLVLDRNLFDSKMKSNKSPS